MPVKYQTGMAAEAYARAVPEHAVTPEEDEAWSERLATGVKHDDGKIRMDLIPPNAERLLAEVLTFGAKKYAPNNWKKVEDAEQRYTAATLRHLNAHRSGEYLDADSGLPHLAHAMCSLAFLLELENLK